MTRCKAPLSRPSKCRRSREGTQRIVVSHELLRNKGKSETIRYVRFLRHARQRTTALDLTYTRHESIEAISTHIANETHETRVRAQWT